MENLSLVSFGIEFETCICVYTKVPLMSFLPYHVSTCNTLASSNKLQAIFRSEDDPRANVDYTKWTFTSDLSVTCYESRPKPVFRSGEISDDVCNRTYVPFELVSPICQYNKDGYKSFTDILSKVIFAPEFLYSSNYTHGLHINISYPGYNLHELNTLLMWWYFEPVIQKFIPIRRRNSTFVKTYRSIFTSARDLSDRYTHFFSDPDSDPAKYVTLCRKSNRFEFRLVYAEMTTKHILSWLGFCARFVVASADFKIPHDGTQGTFEELFKLIDQPELEKYFSQLTVMFDDEEYNKSESLSMSILTDNSDLTDYDISVIFDTYGQIPFDNFLVFGFTSYTSLILWFLTLQKLSPALVEYLFELISNLKSVDEYDILFKNHILFERNKNAIHDYLQVQFQPVAFHLYIIHLLIKEPVKWINSYGIEIEPKLCILLFKLILATLDEGTMIEFVQEPGFPLESKINDTILYRSDTQFQKIINHLPPTQREKYNQRH